MNGNGSQPALGERDTTNSPSLDGSSGPPRGSSLQEWTGAQWVVVETEACAPGFECRPLEPAEVQGQFVGQRVLTPAQPLA